MCGLEVKPIWNEAGAGKTVQSVAYSQDINVIFVIFYGGILETVNQNSNYNA